jgi:competence protein ComEC
MVFYFHRLSLTGLVANVLVTPLISAAIPAGFLTLLTGSGAIAGATGWILARAQELAGFFGRMEPDWPVPAPPFWLALTFVVGLILAVSGAKTSRKWAGTALSVTLLDAFLIVAGPFAVRQTRGELELTLLDTGQSESLLAGLPQGGFVLIDTGGTAGRPGTRSRFDVGEDLIAPYLWNRGIKRLEALVLTHLHEDHAGGAPFLIRSFRPKQFWTSYAPEHPSWRGLERLLKAAGSEIRTAGEGSAWSWGEVKIRALAPSPEQRWRGRPTNNDSLILLLSYGKRKILLTGDAERGVGDRLAEDGLLERVDVLKMPHHGAKSALSAPLLEATSPAVALISAGWRNAFGFPHAETLDALKERRAIPLRTDLLGTVTVRTDGRWLSYESYSESVPGR